MKHKIINTLVVLGFVSIFVFAIGKTMQKEHEFAKKCESMGMIVVEGFRTRPYCAKGARP